MSEEKEYTISVLEMSQRTQDLSNIEIIDKYFEEWWIKKQEEIIELRTEKVEETTKLEKEKEQLEIELYHLKNIKPSYEELEFNLYQKENIIKEVTEYIKEKIELYTVDLTEKNKNKLSYTAPIRAVYKELLEILDKENSNEIKN